MSANVSASNHRPWMLILLSTLILIVTGCGSQEAESELDPLSLLTDYQQAVPRHHPYDLVEIDLGKHEVTIDIQDSSDAYHIGFGAAAIVPKEKKADLEVKLQSFDSRIKDMVIASAQKMSPDNISDPYQAWLKSEILSEIARMIKSRDVRDVVFSDYTFERR